MVLPFVEMSWVGGSRACSNEENPQALVPRFRLRQAVWSRRNHLSFIPVLRYHVEPLQDLRRQGAVSFRRSSLLAHDAVATSNQERN